MSKNWASVFRYTKGRRSNIRDLYERWLREQGLPVRCENPRCRFYSETLVWCDAELSLILDHKNGVPGDNRLKNLRFLCPNCDSLLSSTRGGANRGRRVLDEGGFRQRRERKWAYTLPAETGFFKLR